MKKLPNFFSRAVFLVASLALLASCHKMGCHKKCGTQCESNKQAASAKVEETKSNFQPQEAPKQKKAKKAKKAVVAPASQSTEKSDLVPAAKKPETKKAN